MNTITHTVTDVTPNLAPPVNLHSFVSGTAIRPDVLARMQRTRAAMTDDVLRARAPSVFATEPWGGMSDRYEFIPTIDLVQALRKNGFSPVDAIQSRSRIEGKAEFTKHMLRFRPEEAQHLRMVGDTIPEIVLVNRHDGASGFQLMAGLYRLVCNNGLIVSAGSIGEIRVRHTGDIRDNVIEGSYRVIEEMPKIGPLVQRMQQAAVAPPQALAIAAAARALRWEDQAECPIQDEQLLRIRRQDDAAANLWMVMNRIQENMMQGGLRGKGSTGKRYTTRAVGGVSENVKLNRDIWALGEEALEILA